MLVVEHGKNAREVSSLGISVCMLDLQVKEAKIQQVIQDEGTLVNEMIDTNLISSTGSLVKLSQATNASTIIKAGKCDPK